MRFYAEIGHKMEDVGHNRVDDILIQQKRPTKNKILIGLFWFIFYREISCPLELSVIHLLQNQLQLLWHWRI